MVTLSKVAMRVILNHLDCALADTRRADAGGSESNATWRIRMAREWLLDVAIADVAVEQTSPADPLHTTLPEAA
jgi:hypothetical protein